MSPHSIPVHIDEILNDPPDLQTLHERCHGPYVVRQLFTIDDHQKEQ